MDIEKAFKRLLIKNPFYGLFCMSLPKEVTTDIDTLCISKKGINCQLNINPNFWEQHTDDEQIALLQHELSHICLQHIFMSDSFADPQIFNMAADCEVNSYIDNLPNTAFTAKALEEKFGIQVDKGIGTKKYYELIKNALQQQQHNAQNPTNPCNGGKGGNQSQDSQQDSSPQSSSSPSQAIPDDSQENEDTDNSSYPQSQEDKQEQQESEEKKQYPDNIGGYKSIDSHDTWKDFKNLPEATQQLIQNNINSIVKSTAEQVTKMRGTIPSELVELIEKLNKKNPEIFNWKAYFRRMLGSIYDVNIKSTRRKQSKRFDGAAGIQHKKKVSILVAVDTSGSVSTKELQDFFSEIEYIYKAGARVTIVECDARINKIVEYDGKNIPQIVGRGGTDFNPPVDYYAKHKKEYASLIYFTDGECSLPDKHPSGMVWVITSNGYRQDYPGKAIYIPKENN